MCDLENCATSLVLLANPEVGNRVLPPKRGARTCLLDARVEMVITAVGRNKKGQGHVLALPSMPG